MGKSRAFLVPVCIDDTRDTHADVPDSFSAVQWTRLPGGETPAAFVERVRRLLLPAQGQASAQSHPPARAAAETRPPRLSPVRSRRSQLVVLLIVASAAIGTCYVVLDRFVLSKHSATDAQTTSSSARPAVVAPAVVPEKSIAVLPFVDMSEKKDQEYFSDGLSEELLDLLAQVQDLKVPGRTSSFYFKGKQVTIAEIAKALGVAHVLEGSVRKAGNTFRVTVQLIRADNGYHLWSKTYDRPIGDIFKSSRRDRCSRGGGHEGKDRGGAPGLWVTRDDEYRGIQRVSAGAAVRAARYP